MKQLLIFIVGAGFTFFLFYLIGSFVNTSMMINEWDKGSRVMVGVFGGMFGIIAGFGFAAFHEDQRKER